LSSLLWLNTKYCINLNDIKTKKFVLTALAVVAFSGVAMANTAGVKEEVMVKDASKELSQATPCEDNAIDFYELVIGGGDDNLTLLNDLIGACH
jgi:hypothetical protein